MTPCLPRLAPSPTRHVKWHAYYSRLLLLQLSPLSSTTTRGISSSGNRNRNGRKRKAPWSRPVPLPPFYESTTTLPPVPKTIAGPDAFAWLQHPSDDVLEYLKVCIAASGDVY